MSVSIKKLVKLYVYTPLQISHRLKIVPSSLRNFTTAFDAYTHLFLGKGFGDWEKHTKGIGAKLLLQMGYQPGGGLGKNLEGRAQIVEAFVRKGKAAIGAYGPEGGRPKKEGGRKMDSDEEAEADYQVRLFIFFVFCSVHWKNFKTGRRPSFVKELCISAKSKPNSKILFPVYQGPRWVLIMKKIEVENLAKHSLLVEFCLL